MDKLGQEWVSAVVDGEEGDQAVADLATDKNTHSKWRNYHMIGDAMRGELPETINLDLSANIAKALEQEPEIVAPNMTTTSTVPKSTNKVIPLFKQFGQYAIAASVALVAVVGVQNYQQQDDVEAPISVLNTRPLVGSVSPVSLQTGPVRQLQTGNTNEQVQEQRRRLNSYIQDHMLQQRLNSGAAIDNNVESLPEQ